MQSTTVEEKTLLAKLMATENINVVHKQARTARFNLKTRTLTCPVWKDMDGDLYDLLLGHEISHALHTPPEGWHDVIEQGPRNKAFRNFLNVVEDARIERFLKEKFPGIRKPMMNGYKSLLQRDFFGTSSIDNYNEMYLIDKLNMSAKLGTLVDIRFKDHEKVFYNRMMTVHTWEEVSQLAYDLYEYSKKEQEEGENSKQEQMSRTMQELLEEAEQEEQEMMDEEDFDEVESDEYEYGDEGEESDEDGGEDSDGSSDENGKEGKSSKEGEGDEQGEKDENGNDNGGGGEEDTQEKKSDVNQKKSKKGESDKGQKNKGKNEELDHGTKGGMTKDYIPRVRTDEEFRKKENDLIETDNVEYIDVNIPQVNLKDLLTSADTVNSGIREVYKTQEVRNDAIDLYNKFKKKNHDYIMLLVKEFEMRKAAKAFKRVKLSDSGDIDTKKLPFYRLSDDIFRKMMKVQAGKSHGLVLLMDKSGSMAKHIKGAMEQTLILALFCRKVNIPFIAFTFTSTSGSTKQHDFGEDRIRKGLTPFTKNMGDLDTRDVDLREILNSTMNHAKFTESVINQLVVSYGLGMYKKFDIPYHEGMGGTPLHEALIGTRDVVRLFKKKHGLDIVNTIIIHDGDADSNACYYTGNYRNSRNTFSSSSSYNQVTLHDVKENLTIRLPRGERRGLTIALMRWFQMTTGSGIYGFYITDKGQSELKSALTYLHHNKDGVKFTFDSTSGEHAVHFTKMRERFINEKFIESYTPGYSRFYFIPGSGDLEASDGLIVDTGKSWTPGRLLTAFVKAGKKQQFSRVLVNRFIGMIATE